MSEIDPVSGLELQALALLHEIERVTRGHSVAHVQAALSSALWRSVARCPVVAWTADLDVQAIRLTDGGRNLAIEAALFGSRPPR